MMGGDRGGRRDQGQNQSDPATRISIGLDTRTNALVIAAADPLFEEVKLLVHQLDAANAEQNESVRMVTLHRTSATAVEKALAAFAGDAVQAYNSNTNSPAANSGVNTTSAVPPWASPGYGRMSGGQPSMGNGGPPGGHWSPFQGSGAQRGLRYSQSGRPRQ